MFFIERQEVKGSERLEEGNVLFLPEVKWKFGRDRSSCRTHSLVSASCVLAASNLTSTHTHTHTDAAAENSVHLTVERTHQGFY